MLKIFLLFALILTPTYAYGQKELALNQPIVEGISIAGINIGDSESDVFKVLGFPDKIESTFLKDSPYQGLKFILYGLDKDNLLTMFTRDGKVEVIQLLWSGKGPLYKGKTTKGIGLGDPIDHIKKYYGECEMVEGICWYKDKGILIGGDKVVRLIQVVPPGRELPEYIRSKPTIW